MFIFEYMHEADGEAVKAYLYGLYLCGMPSAAFNADEFCGRLNISKEKALASFRLWEEYGIINIISEEPLEVKYLPISKSKPKKLKLEKYAAFNATIQTLIPERMISVNEYSEYFQLMEGYNLKPEALIMIVKYCVDIKGKDIGYKYILTVAKNFAFKGIITVEGIEKELQNYSSNIAVINDVFKALQLKRKPEIDDVNLYNKWTKQFDFEHENIIYAASKNKKSGMDKLDALLAELYAGKKFSKKEIDGYFAKKEQINALTIKINKTLSIYLETLSFEIDTYIFPWLSMGFDEDALLFIAAYCFKKNRRSLEFMNETVDKLFKRGLISAQSIADFIKESKQEEDAISAVLAECGISRRVNSWDRDNYRMWKHNWNFSDEMILYAAALSAGKNSPVPYMNSILGSFKNIGVYTVEEAKKQQKPQNAQAPAYKGYEERVYTKDELDKLIDKIEDIEI